MCDSKRLMRGLEKILGREISKEDVISPEDARIICANLETTVTYDQGKTFGEILKEISP